MAKLKKLDRICGACLKQVTKDALKDMVDGHGKNGLKPKGMKKSRACSDGDDDEDEDY